MHGTWLVDGELVRKMIEEVEEYSRRPAFDMGQSHDYCAPGTDSFEPDYKLRDQQTVTICAIYGLPVFWRRLHGMVVGA